MTDADGVAEQNCRWEYMEGPSFRCEEALIVVITLGFIDWTVSLMSGRTKSFFGVETVDSGGVLGSDIRLIVVESMVLFCPARAMVVYFGITRC